MHVDLKNIFKYTMMNEFDESIKGALKKRDDFTYLKRDLNYVIK